MCFLFLTEMTEEGLFCLTLDEAGNEINPLLWRAFSDIQKIQKQTKQTILVAPSTQFGIHQVQLPALSEKKARAAIPFALEENLAQNVPATHFAFDKNFYHQGQYLVVVTDKTYLLELSQRLKAKGIFFNTLTIDWFSLNDSEMAILKTYCLVHDKAYHGAIQEDLAPSFLPNLPFERIYFFSDSNPNFKQLLSHPIEEIKENAYIWIAKRLQQKKPFNLFQGDLAQGEEKKNRRWYQAAGMMIFVVVFTFLLTNSIKLYQITQETKIIDSQIATIYHRYFPNSKEVINPKFRLSHYLQTAQTQKDAQFWTLLNRLANSVNTAAQVVQLRYHDQLINLTILAKSFDELETIQASLKKNKVKVKQLQAAKENNKIIGLLEISL